MAQRPKNSHAGEIEPSNQGSRNDETMRSHASLLPGSTVPDFQTPAEEALAPPPYGDALDSFQLSQNGIDAGAAVAADGRVNINISEKHSRLAELLSPALRSEQHEIDIQSELPPAYIPPSLGGKPGQSPPPRMNVVIQIVGSRGDVQPFIALGKVLRETYGHRVRVATHRIFQSFVEDNGLEFFNIGGDPAELMAFMVKNPGLMPGFDAIKSGEVQRRRKITAQMLEGCWRSCIEGGGKGLGAPGRWQRTRRQPSTGGTADSGVTTTDSGWTSSTGSFQDSHEANESEQPFVADAIIANPPSFAHIHVAEKLGVPLHLMFTMPWSPTQTFPHPLANIQSSTADVSLTNYLTYALIEMLTWQGLGDVINDFRTNMLDLSPLSVLWAPGMLSRLRIPYTYCWSPVLIPKPNDWGRHIDISGFYFLNLASSYTPPADLDAFLKAGPPPVYIGFGSIVVDNPHALTQLIFSAVKAAGVRALVSQGWGGLGDDSTAVPENVFMLGNCPHDWLFTHVSAVVHHGGAGTTAAGIQAGVPTVVVPFFGDQPFWGSMVHRAGAGPEPIHNKALTAEKLAAALKECMSPQMQRNAKVISAKIAKERGAEVGSIKFHDHLGLDSLRCSLAPSRIAVWRVRKSKIRLSALAAKVLLDERILQDCDLKLFRAREFDTEQRPWDPISAATAALVSDISSVAMGIVEIPGVITKPLRQMTKSARQGPGTADAARSTGLEESSTSMPNVSSSAKALSRESSVGGVGSSNSRPCIRTDNEPAFQPAHQEPICPSLSAAQSSDESPKQQVVPPLTLDELVLAGKGISRIVTTGVKSPMNFTMGLAKGFRNIPRLYNDETVRPEEKVTGMGSGIKIAAKELGFGFYDGISGLVTQPLDGAKKYGMKGLMVGIGKGIGGLVVKPAAGIWGVPAYTMAGVYAEVRNIYSSTIESHIIDTRKWHGERDFKFSNPAEISDIVARWNALPKPGSRSFLSRSKSTKDAYHSNSTKIHHGNNASTNTLPSADELEEDDDHTKRNAALEQINDRLAALDHRTTISASTSTARNSADTAVDLEHAIQASIRETSQGDAAEDEMIERAIRESVAGIQWPQQQHNSTVEMQEIPRIKQPMEIPAIIGHAEMTRENMQISDTEYQALVEEAIKRSIIEQQHQRHRPRVASQASDIASFSDSKSWLGKADDSVGQSAPSSLPVRYNHRPDNSIVRSATADNGGGNKNNNNNNDDDDGDDDLRKAIEASKTEAAAVACEEEIVLEYIKRQSLAEEEFRRQHYIDATTDTTMTSGHSGFTTGISTSTTSYTVTAAGTSTTQAHRAATINSDHEDNVVAQEDRDLARAIEESLKMSKRTG